MKTHPFDPFSFAAGLIFSAIGVAAAAGVFTDLHNVRVGWPVLLVVVGVLLVGSTIRPRPGVDSAPTLTPGDPGADGLTTGAVVSESAPDEDG